MQAGPGETNTTGNVWGVINLSDTAHARKRSRKKYDKRVD